MIEKRDNKDSEAKDKLIESLIKQLKSKGIHGNKLIISVAKIYADACMITFQSKRDKA